ncbi:hypothetical protein [Frigoribacterium sp. UYMn621]|uniref:hypothetical protein n=1 Tax=Frigoribacterium sp. UYMn621 TaxID=3156343 RepID=UPI00339803EB
MEGPQVKASGVSSATLLTIVFVVLKLTGVIAWSWWLVLSPTLVSIAVALLVLLGFGAVLLWGNLDDRKYARVRQAKKVTK